MGRGRTWKSDEKMRFAEMYIAGATDSEVAEALGRSITAVQSRRHQQGITVRRYISMTPACVAAIDRARGRGWTWRRIGNALGFSAWSLRRRYAIAKGAKQ